MEAPFKSALNTLLKTHLNVILSVHLNAIQNFILNAEKKSLMVGGYQTKLDLRVEFSHRPDLDLTWDLSLTINNLKNNDKKFNHELNTRRL